MTTSTLVLKDEYALSIRWDFDRQTTNESGEALCSICYEPIPDDTVPLLLWPEDSRYVATICDGCVSKAFKLENSCG